jgi:hypothetical protein
VAGSEIEMNTSSGAPVAIALASANEPPALTGATGTPVLDENPVRSAVASAAYESDEYESRGARAIDVVVVVAVDVTVVLPPREVDVVVTVDAGGLDVVVTVAVEVAVVVVVFDETVATS